MKLARALLKSLIEQKDYESWSLIRRDYFPSEYHKIYDEISHFVKNHREVPSLDQLRLAVRDPASLDRLEATIQNLDDTDVPCEQLVEFLRDSYVQTRILSKLQDFVHNSVAFETAEESLESLHSIVIDVEKAAPLTKRDEDMRYIELFEPESISERRIKLGLNTEYDNNIQFAPTDYILIGGRRGAGKSLTCSNIAHQVVAAGKSALYFTIEMDSRSILQRAASIATGVPHTLIRKNELEHRQLLLLAEWWCQRFVGGESVYEQYKVGNIQRFAEMHEVLSNEHELEPGLDIVYDPGLTVTTIEAEVKKRNNLGVVIVDYINQIRPVGGGKQYDWDTQIEVSKFLKSLAQDLEVPVISPYQIDKTGEARFSKGILDSADAAFVLEAYTSEDKCMTFKCEKMRNEEEIDFTSEVDWPCLRIGPNSALTPEERDAKTEVEIDDSEADL